MTSSQHAKALSTTLLLCLALALSACGDDDNNAQPDSGQTNCDATQCTVSLEDFQSASLHCADDYADAQAEYQNTASQCVYALFECENVNGAAYQYGFTGDNVQCYYDDTGTLVGAVRTSDHGVNTVAGNVPTTHCYVGPDCADQDGGV